DALELWRGDALIDVGDAPFAEVDRVRLTEMRIATIEARIDADVAVGRHADLVPELEYLVAAHPLREHLRAQPMLALSRSGRQTEALRSYETARTVLADEVGLEPSPELRALESAILRQDGTTARRDPVLWTAGDELAPSTTARLDDVDELCTGAISLYR